MTDTPETPAPPPPGPQPQQVGQPPVVEVAAPLAWGVSDGGDRAAINVETPHGTVKLGIMSIKAAFALREVLDLICAKLADSGDGMLNAIPITAAMVANAVDLEDTALLILEPGTTNQRLYALPADVAFGVGSTLAEWAMSRGIVPPARKLTPLAEVPTSPKQAADEIARRLIPGRGPGLMVPELLPFGRRGGKRDH